MSESWSDDEGEREDLNEYTRFCACGCSQAEHTATGCVFCYDCECFTYDPDTTLIAALFEDLP